MALRADQWLMIGVGGLGAYALYRLLSTKPDQGGGDMPILGTTTTAPPGTFEFDQNMLYQGLGRPPRTEIRLTPNWYRGRLEVPVTPTGVIPERNAIAAQLRSLGFDPIFVYMPEEADTAIPLPALKQNPTAQSRWFYGRWIRPAGSVLSVPAALKAIIPSDEPSRPRTAGHYAYGPRYAVRPFRYL